MDAESLIGLVCGVAACSFIAGAVIISALLISSGCLSRCIAHFWRNQDLRMRDQQVLEIMEPESPSAHPTSDDLAFSPTTVVYSDSKASSMSESGLDLDDTLT